MLDANTSTTDTVTVAVKFIKAMFGLTTELPVYICSFPNERNDETEPPERHVSTRAPSRIDGFVKKWDRPKRGLFFCTGIVKGERRAKEHICQRNSLHADIDLKYISDSRDDVLRILKTRLRYPPTIIVFSGHGLHAYWLFKEAFDINTPKDVERIEAALKQLADLVGGDFQCAEISRVMRLVGSHNTKDGGWIPVEIVEQNDHRFELDDLEEMLSEQAPVILRKVRPPDHSLGEIDPNFFTEYAGKHAGYKPPIDVEKRLAQMTYMVDGDAGIHATQIAVTSSLLSRGYPLDDVVALVMEATRIAAGEYGARWNWKREERAVRRDGAKWIKDHPDILEKQRERAKMLEEENPPSPKPALAKPDAKPKTLADVHKVFHRWLGEHYDLDALNAVLAVAACERLPGDPPWLLVISGSGNAKTETVQSVSGLGAHVVSTIASEGALLSATSKGQREKNATGGLLRVIGERGILVIKDFTSIISTNRDVRTTILAALREIYDGQWVRNVGTGGGRTLKWNGRIVVIGACTTAWDAAHAVVSSMGDRFILIRPNSRIGRAKSGLQAIRNTGNETAMRKEMADAVAGLVGHIDANATYALTADDEDKIVTVADIVTLARTGVETDYRGDVIDAHDPEAPTRLAKQLCMILRGAMAAGMAHDDALRLVIRCARDSMPQLRLSVLLDVAAHPDSPVIEIRRRLQKPRTTVERILAALQMLGLLECREEERERDGRTVQVRFYRLGWDVDATPLTGTTPDGTATAF